MRTTFRFGVTIAVLALSTVFGAAAAQAAPPANDNFADAVTISDGVETTGTNDEATMENPAEQNSFPSWGLNNSVWMTFTPASDGVVEIEVCSEFRTNLIAFTGAAYGSLTTAQSVAPFSYAQGLSAGPCTGGAYPTSIGPFYVTGGVPLQIHLGSAYGGETGDYALTATHTPSPVNDDFAARELLTNGETTTGNNDFATIEPTEQAGGLGWGIFHSDWYTFTPNDDGVVEISTCAEFPTNTIVFTGTSLAALTRASTSPSSAAQGTTGSGCPNGTYPSFIGPFEVTGGTELQIHLGSAYQDNTGDFEITVDYFPYPENDDFADATELTSGVASDGDSTYATLEPSEEAYAVGLNNTVWYSFDPATTGELEMDVCSAFPSHVTAWTGSSVDNLTLLKATAPVSQATSSTASCASGTRSRAYLPPINVAPGTEIFFQVTGQYSADEGELTARATLHTTPTYDALAGAFEFGNGNHVEFQDDNFATAANQASEPLIAGASRPGSTWHRWQAQTTGDVTIDTCDDLGTNTSIGVFTSAVPSPAMTDLIAVPNGAATGGCSSGNGAKVTIQASSGSYYWIAVANDSAADWHGRFTVKLGVHAVSVSGPSIEGDDFFVGTELTLNPGSWGGRAPLTFEYQWQRCDATGDDCVDIPGEDGLAYTLAAADQDLTVRALVTATNPINTVVADTTASPQIDADSDGDTFGDRDDACPDNANESPKTNGCPVEGVVVTAPPTISGAAQVGSVLTISLGSASNTPGVDPGMDAPTSTIYWYSCSSPTIEGTCQARTGTNTNYTPTAADLGRFIRAEVAWINDDDSEISAWTVASAAITNPPVVTPPVDNTPPPAAPAPVNPLTLPTAPKSLGTVKAGKKGAIKLSKLNVTCAASATGPCTGAATLSVKLGKKVVKFGATKQSIAAGKSAPIQLKISASNLKKLKKAKKGAATLTISIGAPGFPASTLKTGFTLKP